MIRRVSSHPLKTFTFDDPTGLALENHVAACARAGWEPVSVPWPIVDPSQYIVARIGQFPPDELAAAEAALLEDGVFADANWSREYLDREFVVDGCGILRFTSETLARTAVKFGWAVAYAAELAAPFHGDVEFAFDRTDAPATAIEHLFIALELKRRGIPVPALALRFPGEWEPAVEFAGDLAECERAIGEHAAIARFAGGHHLSIGHGEEKFAVLPALARECGNALHFKTSGVSWLVAMRTLARVEPDLLRAVLREAQEHFVFAKIGHLVSTTEDDVRFLPDVPDAELERTFLDDFRGRQLLQLTAGSIALEPVREALIKHGTLFHELVAAQLDRLLSALTATPDAT